MNEPIAHEIINAQNNERVCTLYAIDEKTAAKRYFKRNNKPSDADDVFVRPLSQLGSDNNGLNFTRRNGLKARPTTNGSGNMKVFTNTRKRRDTKVKGHDSPQDSTGKRCLSMYRVCAPPSMYEEDFDKKALVLAGRCLMTHNETAQDAAEQFAMLLPDWPVVIVRRVPELYDNLRTPKVASNTWNVDTWIGFEILRDYAGEITMVRQLDIDAQGNQRWYGPRQEAMSDEYEEELERQQAHDRKEREAAEREAQERLARAQRVIDEKRMLDTSFGPIIHHKDGPVV